MTDDRCPHCGGPVRVNMIDVGNGPSVEYMPGSYECAQEPCPVVRYKLAENIPLTEHCPKCGSCSAIRQMIELPVLGQPRPWPMVGGELRCFTCEARQRYEELNADAGRLIEAVQYKNRPLLERLLDRWRNFWAMD